MMQTRLHSRERPVPRRALAISVAALAVPVAVVFWFPDWTSSGLGMLIWLTALIPAFLLSYYRGLAGVAVALAGGMAVITATQVSIVVFEIAEPDWLLLLGIVSIYLVISLGVAGLSEILRRERRAAEDMALVDALTGLPNRRHLEIVLDREFAAAERGRPLAVVIFDLDHFKQVNDKHGHAAGDETIKAFAKVLLGNTRKENLSARFGGEEFVAVLRESSTEAALIFSQRVLDQMRACQLAWGHQTVSAGIAEYEKGMGSYELLLGAADRALYKAKEEGRDRVCAAPRHTERASENVPRLSGAMPVIEGDGPTAPPAGTRLYLVDDDEAVRNVLKRMLTTDGYHVWDTGDPIDAIAHFAGALPHERPDVVLTDVIMPEMTGMRMIDAFTKISPDVKVIYMSGYVQSTISWGGTPGAVVTFLEKPFERDALLGALQGVRGEG